MDTLLQLMVRRQPDMVRLLRHFVERESPSTDKAAVDRFGRLVGTELSDLGATVRFAPSRTTGNHLLARFRFATSAKARQILLLGHLDTVWPEGTLATMPFRTSGGKAYGPGTFDMKAGIVIAMFAVQSLRELAIPLKKDVALLLNADEEIGSPASRRLTERQAAKSDYVLVVEPSHGPRGALKTARKGVGEFILTVHGRAAHAGIEPEKGASAIHELSRHLISLERLANRIKGATLNAGVISGGTRSNVIPAEATAHIDARVVRAADHQKIEKYLRSLRPFDRRTSIEVSGGFNRPPMERTKSTSALFERARRLAQPLGISLAETAVGGGSDGNFTAALGVPTLDGLGAVGDGAHAQHEHVIIRELSRRAALLAHLIASLASE